MTTTFAILIGIAGCYFALGRIRLHIERRRLARWWAKEGPRIVKATRDRRPLDIGPALKREC